MPNCHCVRVASRREGSEAMTGRFWIIYFLEHSKSLLRGCTQLAVYPYEVYMHLNLNNSCKRIYPMEYLILNINKYLYSYLKIM